jgi:hypothetical protein
MLVVLGIPDEVGAVFDEFLYLGHAPIIPQEHTIVPSS